MGIHEHRMRISENIPAVALLGELIFSELMKSPSPSLSAVPIVTELRITVKEF